MGAAVERRAAIPTDEMREAGRVSTDLRRRRQLLVAETAVDRRSHSTLPGFGAEHPRSQLERRLVPDMPPMPAGELGDPHTMLIPTEIDDCAQHSSKICPRKAVLMAGCRAARGVRRDALGPPNVIDPLARF
jgi:hypothetical protein